MCTDPDTGPRSAVIISASSDIGAALAMRWRQRGWRVSGSFRTDSRAIHELRRRGVRLVHCDLEDAAAVKQAAELLGEASGGWDALVLCPATQEPVGAFADCSFDEWERSIVVNFTAQMRLLHGLLPSRRPSRLGPCVLLFAGGGTNDAPTNYSAYIISKIASIKICELLDAELSDTRFVILGPGWVKTKIHRATLEAGNRAGANLERTRAKLAGDECTPMATVLDGIDWAVAAPRRQIGGRNFSVVFDRWGSDELAETLAADDDMYKLRRYGNDWRPGEPDREGGG